MKAAENPRLIMVGSVTGNDNTVGGGGVYPIADLKDLDGLAQGAKEPISMIDGFNFNGAKAYKDTKMCLMMTSNTLHDRYHRSTGIAFSAIYPGCIAESPLFREKRPWFRKYFPVFMKYVTGGFVGEVEAGQRLGQVVADPRCSKSGVYWSWNGGPRQGRGMEALKNGGNIVGAGGAGGDWESIFENDQSDKVRDPEKMALLWKYSNEVIMILSYKLHGLYFSTLICSVRRDSEYGVNHSICLLSLSLKTTNLPFNFCRLLVLSGHP